jgi:hypothetical protein
MPVQLSRPRAPRRVQSNCPYSSPLTYVFRPRHPQNSCSKDSAEAGSTARQSQRARSAPRSSAGLGPGQCMRCQRNPPRIPRKSPDRGRPTRQRNRRYATGPRPARGAMPSGTMVERDSGCRALRNTPPSASGRDSNALSPWRRHGDCSNSQAVEDRPTRSGVMRVHVTLRKVVAEGWSRECR